MTIKGLFGLSWKGFADLLSDKVTAFSDLVPAAKSTREPITSTILQDCEREKDSLQNRPEVHPQVIRHFGLHPACLWRGNKRLVTMTGTPFTLLWFYAWNQAQRLLLLETRALAQGLTDSIVPEREVNRMGTLSYKQTRVRLTLKNGEPETKLASVTTVASQLCYSFSAAHMPPSEQIAQEFDVPAPERLLESGTTVTGHLFGNPSESLSLALEDVSRTLRLHDIHSLGPFLDFDRQLLRPSERSVRNVLVTRVRPDGPTGCIIHFTEPEWGARILHVRYNVARMNGLVSREQHEAALDHLRKDIAEKQEKQETVSLGYFGEDLAKLPGTRSEYGADALQLYGNVVYARPVV